MAQYTTRLEQQGVLDVSRNDIVEGLDFGPERSHIEYLASNAVGSRYRAGVGTGFLLCAKNKCRAHAIYDTVGDQCRNNFPLQRMQRDEIAESISQTLGEVLNDIFSK